MCKKLKKTMTESLEVSAIFPVSKQNLYEAWLDSEQHSLFTGGEAKISPVKDEKYTAWDDYISGITLELEPFSRIMQTWRTTEFDNSDPDSMLEILFEEVSTGTKITLKHTEIPAGQSERYKNGWEEHYFEPMRIYFESKV